MPENPKTPASEGGREHTLETAAEEGSGYGGPFPVDPGPESATPEAPAHQPDDGISADEAEAADT